MLVVKCPAVSCHDCHGAAKALPHRPCRKVFLPREAGYCNLGPQTQWLRFQISALFKFVACAPLFCKDCCLS